ncbi:MAG: YbaB/EbfC family nucleoid-associated protein [Alphaproteobacteria bacterium]
MDMEQLMAQAQELQNKVSAAQDKLGEMSVKGIAGAGDCIIEMSGKYDLINLTISDKAMSLDATELSNVVSSAFRDAKSKADSLIEKVMADATAGVSIPGM